MAWSKKGLFLAVFIGLIFASNAFGQKHLFPTAPFTEINKNSVEQLENDIRNLVPTCATMLSQKLLTEWPRKRNGWPKRLKIDFVQNAEELQLEGHAETSGDFFVRMTFNAAPFINGTADLKMTVCHETAHAFYRYKLSMGEYSRIPRWLREGSAVYLANQVLEKERKALFNFWLKNENPLNGLDGKHSFKDYYEDSLALVFLKERFNADLNFLQDLIEGKSWEESITKLTGLSASDFIKEAKLFADQYLAQQTDHLSAELKLLISDYKSRNYVASTRLAKEILNVNLSDKEKQNSLDAGLAISVLINSYQKVETGIYEKAILIPAYFYGNDKAQLRYKMAGAYLENNQAERALKFYSLVFSDHAEVPILAQSATAGILRSYVALAQWENVLDWSEREKGLHPSNLVEYRYYRGLAYQGLGKVDKARKLFSQVCQMQDNRVFRDKACELIK